MWRRLTELERQEAEQRIEGVGKWLREGEPAQTVAEDLLGFQVRSLLVELSQAVSRGRKGETERLILAVEACIMELYIERSQRKR